MGVVTVSLGGILLIVLLIRGSQNDESVARLRAATELTLGYSSYTVIKTFNVSIQGGHFTAIIGPNSGTCGGGVAAR